MITDADIRKMKKVFVTKDDIKNFVTKEDSKNFVTKQDSKKFATKEDLIDFKDTILGEIIKIREDMTIIIGYRDLIEDHDKRIEKLEYIID